MKLRLAAMGLLVSWIARYSMLLFGVICHEFEALQIGVYF